MNRYTVILIYPQDIADYDGENYLAHVEACTPHQAACEARKQYTKEHIDGEPESEHIANKLIIAAVFAGHHDDIK